MQLVQQRKSYESMVQAYSTPEMIMGTAYHTLKSFRTATAAFLCALYNLCYCMMFLGLVQTELEYCREPVL
jgi:hypothetical protein